MRECGPCQMCCKVLDFTLDDGRRYAKGVWCEHASFGDGCGIYDTRSGVCRHFKCAWLTSPALSEDLRPDLCRVVIAMHYEGEEQAVLATVDQDYPMAHLEPRVMMILAGLAWEGHAVAAVIGDRVEVVLEDGTVMDKPPDGSP